VTNGAKGCSTCQVSIDSSTADSFASSGVTPLPWDTASVRDSGRIAWYVGMPMVSSRVMSATRVTPTFAAARLAISSVAVGG
jgi:hypothetical protein